MNAPAFRHTAAPAGPFLLFDAENWIDPIVCRTEADLRASIDNLDGLPFQVLTIAVDEFCRDVTAEYLPVDAAKADEYPAAARAASAADRAFQFRKEQF